jgi:hypothetical protein
MRAGAAPAITDEQRNLLTRWVRTPRTPQSLVLRARIVLMAADGHTNQEIAMASSSILVTACQRRAMAA